MGCAESRGRIIIVDIAAEGRMATPIQQRLLELGADIATTPPEDLAWIIHDECRPRRKPLILLSYATGADFVEFSVTRPSDRPFP